MNIKKVIKRIYEFDFSNCEIRDGSEIMATSRVNEFLNTFKYRNIDEGIIVTPSGYIRGFIFKTTNGGEIYNNPTWEPDIITFAYNIYGLKKGAFYKITVKGRNAREYNKLFDITDDRTLEISNDDSDIIINHDFSEDLSNTEITSVFRASSTELNLFFRVGKIYLNDIIIDEVELLTEEKEDEIILTQNDEITENSISLVSYAIFDPKVNATALRYSECQKLTGKGINLYFDTKDKKYILERDNVNDIIGNPFTNINYIIDINTTKLVQKNIFDKFMIANISNDISPNTLKQGYLEFQLLDEKGNSIDYSADNGRIAIIIKSIN